MPHSPGPPGGPRFAAGRVLAGRYRVVELLGQGSMGEVYRADDLTLGEPVALKFLPGTLARDPDRLRRFHGEVRLAHQVTHPNVCRVHDIGDADGQPFLTMEYIDGKDLAALLQQVGRLPAERGVAIARQLCLGLAAVHDKKVLHRDLKPANVMIDSRGQVHLTDFGLAAVAEDARGDEARAGTPAYQAPEQRAGKEVTVQSDLYSLGLVLYELFTGQHAFPANSGEELTRLQQVGTPSRPSSHVTGLDPAVDRCILCCLEKDPRQRPRSALAVEALLPAAGDKIPSPEAVRDMGEEGSLPPVLAASLLAVFLLGIALIAFLNDRVALFRKVPLDLPPAVLVNKAQELLKKLGGHELDGDSGYGFANDQKCLRHLAENDSAPDRWERLATGQPAAVYFWYRQSPHELIPQQLPIWQYPGRMTPADPPEVVPGMASVFLDLKGRLLEYHVVPRRDGYAAGPAPEPDWKPFFAAAGLDPDQFEPAVPHWTPPYFSDPPRAWSGTYSDRPDLPLHVEAASSGGEPIFFQLAAGPWSEPERSSGVFASARTTAADYFFLALVGFLLVGGSLLARRNWRRGRADRRGSLRFAAVYALILLLALLCVPGRVPSVAGGFVLLIRSLGVTAFWAGVFWILYLAAEPAVRRRWPWLITSWNRLFAGRFRDPLVGRDLLVGGLFGLFCALVRLGAAWAPVLQGQPVRPTPQVLFGSFNNVLFGIVCDLNSAMDYGWIFLTLLLLASLLLRRRWLAIALLYVVGWVYFSLTDGASPAELVSTGLIVAACVLVLLRFGILALVLGFYMADLLLGRPFTLHFSAWYIGSTVVYLLIAAGLVGYGFVISLGGRPLLGEAFFEDGGTREGGRG
jgi:serine/threonine-protein kinase